jgi:hypothetical protein
LGYPSVHEEKKDETELARVLYDSSKIGELWEFEKTQNCIGVSILGVVLLITFFFGGVLYDLLMMKDEDGLHNMKRLCCFS